MESQLRKYHLELYVIGRGASQWEERNREKLHFLQNREIELSELHMGMQLRLQYGTEELDWELEDSPVYVTVTGIEANFDRTNRKQDGPLTISASIDIKKYGKKTQWGASIEELLDYWEYLNKQKRPSKK